MKLKLPLNNFCSFLLVMILFLGFQTLSQAQLTIKNKTSCTIYVQASQVKNGATQPCTRCNVSNITAIPSGGTWVHPGDATCGHFRWLGVRWTVQGSPIVGVSYNPVWNGTCGQSGLGARCLGNATYARWNVPSSPGPATVVINNF